MEAASVRSADLVGLLLTHGADVEIKDSRGRTVNDIARKRRNARVISTLETYAEEHKIH
jgi:ankyrin repeat protein